MGENTSIAWTHRTFNAWWGCSKIGPGCDHCYAASFDKRVGGDHWGPDKPRRYFGDKHWNQPRKWNREALGGDPRRLVFCSSMADVFDNQVEQHHRERLWALIKETPALVWQIVTKRIGNAPDMLPADWGDGYPNVWLLSTVVNQPEADRDIDKLLRVPAIVHGLSVEPQLEEVDVRSWMSPYRPIFQRVTWVISGGESGKARPFNIAWARSLRDQCAAAGTHFFLKQFGHKPVGVYGLTGKGEDPAEWPEDVRVRNFPPLPDLPSLV